MRLACIPAVFGLVLAAGQACGVREARYVVTSEPLDVGAIPHSLCVAIDRTDPAGIWWWEPGRSGCASRSTGPDVFHAERAVVTPRPDGRTIDARFRLDLIRGPGDTRPAFADVVLVLEGDTVRSVQSGVRVGTWRRRDLQVPELGPGGR